MSAVNSKTCTCELCQPNWFLGRDDYLMPQAEPQAEQATLEIKHAHKVRASRADENDSELMPAAGCR